MAEKILPQEIIRKKRDQQPLSRAEVKQFVAGVTDLSVSEGQVAAFAMAVYFNGMNEEEAVGLTLGMRDSGTILNWNELDGPILDKHSTGGVGDNVSLMLAPAVAACGGFVPMISGRGLGHTGGTLDKFDSIPGYQTQPGIDLFRATVKSVGCAIIGQTSDLAPADKRIYAIRDVTSTVESVPLITASILSKKLAAGLSGLVLDVKTGSGAFMDNIEKSRNLAASLVKVANGAGLKTTALLTDMDHPLASAAGNGVEMINAIQFLTGEHRDQRLWEITNALGGEMLKTGRIVSDRQEGIAKMEEAFQSGNAAERFSQMVAQLGGPKDIVEEYDRYMPRPAITRDVYAKPEHKDLAGCLGFDTRQIGNAVIELGGGRTRPQDAIDHRVGLVNIARRNWDGLQPLCTILAADEDSADRAERRIINAVRRSGPVIPSILETMG